MKDEKHIMSIAKVIEDKAQRSNRLQKIVCTHKDFMLADIEPIEWLVPNMIPSPGLVAISGRPGHYKTFFAMWMVKRLSAGLPLFLGGTHEGSVASSDTPVPSLFIEQEMSRRQMRTRADEMQDYDGGSIYWAIGGGVNLQSQGWIQDIVQFVGLHSIRLIVLDPFSSIASLKDENSNAEASKLMDTIRHNFVDSELECTVIFLHHPSKGDDKGSNLRGAGDILGKCDVHLSLQKIGGKERIVRVRYEKNRNADEACLKDFEMQLNRQEDTDKLFWSRLGTVPSDDKRNRIDDFSDKILEMLSDGNPHRRKDIAKQLGVTSASTAFTNAWKSLTQSGVVKRTKNGFVLVTETLPFIE